MAETTLYDWMRRENLSLQAVADRLGVSQNYVERLRRNAVHPPLALGLAVHDLSKGEIPLETLLPRHLRPAPSRRPAKIAP